MSSVSFGIIRPDEYTVIVDGRIVGGLYKELPRAVTKAGYACEWIYDEIEVQDGCKVGDYHRSPDKAELQDYIRDRFGVTVEAGA